MKEKVGEIFSIAKDNIPIDGCTISKEIYNKDNYISYYSLASNTDISAEIYPYHKFIFVNDGSIKIYDENNDFILLSKEESFITQIKKPIGIRSNTGAIYTEISIRRTDKMNNQIKAGEVFKLKDLIPYQDGKIINMDIVSNQKMKFVIMAFDAGTGLSEHAAPGEAIIFALEGEGIIGYEGKEYTIKEGENFHFAKGGLHLVKAENKFKMGLLLTLE